MSCEKHTDKDVLVFCEDCDTLVCCECMIETHKNHEFKKLAKAAEERREKILNEYVSKRKNILSDLRKRYQQLEVSKNESSTFEESIIKDIQDRAQKIKTHVDYIKDKQVLKVRGLFQSQREELDKKTTSINDASEKLTKLSDKKESLKNESDIEIIQLYMCIYKQLKDVRKKGNINLIEGKFLSDGDFETNLEKIFGSFENENETSSDDLDLPGPVNIKSWKLERVDIGLKGTLQSLHLTGDDSGWILCNSILYFANSISKKKYKEKAKNVKSFAVSKDGEVFFVTNSTVVQKINTNGTVTRWCEMAPYKPQHIFISKPNEINVNLAGNRMNNHESYLWRFDKNGRKLDKGNHGSFQGSFCKILKNEFGELCLHSGSGSLFTVDVNMSKSEFNGILGANPRKNYNITDVCYISKGRIVALDNINNVVYLLDRKCSFIGLITSIDEIKSPECVTLDQFDRLWISSSSGTYILSNSTQLKIHTNNGSHQAHSFYKYVLFLLFVFFSLIVFLITNTIEGFDYFI